MTDEPPPSLLPDALRADLPPLYATESHPDPIVKGKLFTPWSSWTWYVTEFDGNDTCFGLVTGHEVELGYFSLAELAALKGPGGLRVERDLHFSARPLSKVREEVNLMRGDNAQAQGDRCSEFNALGAYSNPGSAPKDRDPADILSPFVSPGIKLLETRLADLGPEPRTGRVHGPKDAARILKRLIGQMDREHFVALYLNGRYVVTHAHIISRGTTQNALVHPREVFKGAVLANASAVIVGHNHPTGQVDPSPEDEAVTTRLKSAGELLGITVVDAVIVGPTERFYSSNNGATAALDPIRPGPGDAHGQEPLEEAHLEGICENLMRDIDEVLERQGEAWWDETVTAGRNHRRHAEEWLGRDPFEPLCDMADDPFDGPA